MSGSPLDQFKIKYFTDIPHVSGVNLNFSNSSLFMSFAVISVSLFLILSMKNKSLVPGRWQSLAEMFYEFVAGTFKDYVGNEGKQFFPVIFTLFMFILACNVLGLFPYSFTVTSHFIVTFALASFIFLGVTLIAIIKHKWKFFGYFIPEGTPLWMAPLMFLIELFAYLARPISLSVRLGANMLAGHSLLKVIAGFVFIFGIEISIFPIAFLVILNGFELFVAMLQAYIFTVLSCVYLNDAIKLH